MNSINDPKLKRDKKGRYKARLNPEEIANFRKTWSINKCARHFQCSTTAIMNAEKRFYARKGKPIINK